MSGAGPNPALAGNATRGATMTHDDKLNGTIDLFAAMTVGTGQVHSHLRPGLRVRTCRRSSSRSTQRPARVVGARDLGPSVGHKPPRYRRGWRTRTSVAGTYTD